MFAKKGLADLQEMRGDHRRITTFGAEEQTWGVLLLLIVENDIYKCTMNLQFTPAAIVDEA